MMNFIPVKIVYDILKLHLPQPLVSEIDLLASKGYICAADYYAPIDVPSFDNAAMDGYVIRWDDWFQGIDITPSGIIKAGILLENKLLEGEAFKIFTGAPIPEGGDTVVMQEWVENMEKHLIFLDKPIKKGDHIRLKGSQTLKGTLILKKGMQINSGIISFLATFGIRKVKVYDKPKISLVVTGDELVSPGKSLKHGQIYESNGVALTALLDDLRIQPVDIFYAKDNLKSVTTSIASAFKISDIVLITGGISVGDFDFVQTSLESLGVQKLFYKIMQKPGKPLFFGKKDSRLVFALPGNPAAVFSCFHAYIKPLIKKWMQSSQEFIVFNKGKAANNYYKKKGLTHWVKAIENNGELFFLEGQESYRMDSIAIANAMVCLPESIEQCLKGDELNYISL